MRDVLAAILRFFQHYRALLLLFISVVAFAYTGYQVYTVNYVEPDPKYLAENADPVEANLKRFEDLFKEIDDLREIPVDVTAEPGGVDDPFNP